MDARIIIFNDGLKDIICPIFRVRHLEIDFVFSYTMDGLSVDGCTGEDAQYYCYSVDGGGIWKTLEAGGTIKWPDLEEAVIIVRNKNQNYPLLTCRVEKVDNMQKWENFLGDYDFPGKSEVINDFKLRKLVGDIVSKKVDCEDYSFVNETTSEALYDFFVNPSAGANMRDVHISRALDRLKAIL